MKKLVFFLPITIIALFAMSGCANTPANVDTADLQKSAVETNQVETNQVETTQVETTQKVPVKTSAVESNSNTEPASTDSNCVKTPGREGFIAWQKCLDENKN